MKNFEEIEAFVRKAMDKDLLVNIRTNNEIVIRNDEYAVYFFKYKDSEYCNVTISLYNNRGTFTNYYSISITDRESVLFDLLVEDINDYSQSYAQNILDNFFGEDNSVKTIDNLEFD